MASRVFTSLFVVLCVVSPYVLSLSMVKTDGVPRARSKVTMKPKMEHVDPKEPVQSHKKGGINSFITNRRNINDKLRARGLIPSVFTPFNEKGQLKLSEIPKYAEYLKKSYVDGALVGGTASEGPALSLRERKDLLDAWVKAAKPLGLTVVMQVGGLPLPEVLELASYSETAEADAILTLPELYYKPKTEDVLVSFVKQVSEAAPSLPILYYDHPSLSGVKLNMAKFFGLATEAIANFKGMKCDFVTALEISASNEVRDDQRIFMASHTHLLGNFIEAIEHLTKVFQRFWHYYDIDSEPKLTTASSTAMGYNSSMTTITNLFPELMRDIRHAVGQNDIPTARELQKELNTRVAVITEKGEYVPFVKAAMEMITGIKVGRTRDPVSHVTDRQWKVLNEELQRLNITCAEC